MNTISDRLKHHFSESIQTKINSADTLLPTLTFACEKVAQCLLDGHKIMSCGHGGSATTAEHFSGQMLNRFKQERPSLPAIAFTDIIDKQVRALGLPGDLLLAISTSGHSVNILDAIKAAHDKKINVIALTGSDGGKIAHILQDSDIEIRVPAHDSTRIQETHLLIIHCLYDIVEFQLFGHGEVIS